jgi:signal transduction histidine kinase
MRDYLRRLLGVGYDVEAVADGNAALAAAREHLPDLVLADVMMPGLDGFGLLASLRADPRTRTIPVIMLSARAGEEARVEGLQAGADDYLTKPFSARELMARVQSHLEMARLRRESEAALRQADRRKDEFLAMLAHELRNPLASVRNAAQLLARLAPDEPRLGRARQIIERQVEHQARLLDDLLDVSRITRGKIGLRPVPVDLAALVRDAVEDARGMCDDAGLTLSLSAPPEPIWVEADPTRLAQVVSNLLSNAAKFTDRGGAVTVGLRTGFTTCAAGGEHAIATLTVKDTGIGIEPEMLPHLFETFTQADRSLDRSRGGLGLGLALVKGLIALHGGEVRAASDGLGQGAEFTVWLPMLDTPTQPAAVPVATTRRSAPLRVLIVEDQPDAADTLRDLLELDGCTVAVAYSGHEAVEVAPLFCPELVLCDLGLPGLNGYEVAARLRQCAETAGARLIALTGYGGEEESQRCREAGFDRHLTKPVGAAELARLLQRDTG